MAFPVSSRVTGNLITESIWNSDIVDNLNYLKGLAGAVAIEDDVTLSLGKKLTADKVFAGPRFALHKGSVREVVIPWEDDSGSNYQITSATDGASAAAVNMGGTGQIVLSAVTNLASSYSLIYNKAEVNNAFDTSFNVGRNPYMRLEFVANNAEAGLNLFMGFRATPSDHIIPNLGAEVCAGLFFNGAIWLFANSEGTAGASLGTETVANDRRHTFEILIVEATKVEYYLDGVYRGATTTHIPTGDLEWQITVDSAGGGAAAAQYITLGKLILQEDLV